jgi:hypothetical protein
MKRCFQLLAFRVIQFLDLLKANEKNDEKLETNSSLEAEFGQTDVEFFFYPTLKKFLILSSYQKVMAVLTNHLQVRVSKVWYRLG